MPPMMAQHDALMVAPPWLSLRWIDNHWPMMPASQACGEAGSRLGASPEAEPVWAQVSFWAPTTADRSAAECCVQERWRSLANAILPRIDRVYCNALSRGRPSTGGKVYLVCFWAPSSSSGGRAGAFTRFTGHVSVRRVSSLLTSANGSVSFSASKSNCCAALLGVPAPSPRAPALRSSSRSVFAHNNGSSEMNTSVAFETFPCFVGKFK